MVRCTYGWPFYVPAILILIFAFGVPWWGAILCALLAATRLTRTTIYRR